ncbi:MAG: dipicolinate synthase subunit B [Peptococcaceae bacterium]|nr:dipicolinate synthase subunit B [Candidatus Syntrophopropionicum ammoniitolerans]
MVTEVLDIMRLKGIRVGFALTGSHCCLDLALPQVNELAAEGAEIFPIISDSVDTTDTRYGTSEKWERMLCDFSGRQILKTITEVEDVGPKKLFDIMVVAPCTGNTLAKVVNGITDGAVLMSVKAHLRNQRPVVLAISTNDGLGLNAKNIGLLLNVKNIYMVPFGQDNPLEKPNSLVAKWDLITETVLYALNGRQYQPVLTSY